MSKIKTKQNKQKTSDLKAASLLTEEVTARSNVKSTMKNFKEHEQSRKHDITKRT